ncbi:MAG: glycosyl hydrolase family 18 protein, partial [Clostridia bacterium]
FHDTGRVSVVRPGDSYAFGVLVETTEPRGSYAEAVRQMYRRIVRGDSWITLRQENHPKADVLLYLEVGERVDIIDEDEGWLRVFARGVEGYVPKNSVKMAGVRTAEEGVSDEIERLPDPVDWDSWNPDRPLDGERVTLVWEHVSSVNPDVEDIGEMPGLNVISPTWFSLEDERGRFASRADVGYVRWAKERGLLVWGLATNSFDPELTAAALRDPDAREEMVRQLITYAAMYRLDGINIDFENVYFEDRELLTQFIRELAPRAHALGLTLSMDVTMISTSRTWSMCYDREALAGVVDYLILMAYDEHWASSPVAGSVGSLPWVENGLRAVLKEVPADRLILGIPFYTRVWREVSDGSAVQVDSEAIGMNTQKTILKEHEEKVTWDERAAQYYLEYQDGEDSFKIWIENETSLRARLNLVQRYDLAGVAAWRRGLEIPEFWPIIREQMSHWP